MLLTDISPRAAKLYLALSTLAPPHADPPTARIHLTTLAKLVNLSTRSCAYALHELQTVNLITRLPRRGSRNAIASAGGAGPCAYQILPFPYTHPRATLPTHLQPVAASPTPNLQPIAGNPTSNLQPVAGNPKPTPIPASKTHNLQPAAAYKPNPPTPATDDPNDDPLLNPALLKFLMNSLSPSEKAAILAPFQPTIAALTERRNSP